MEKLSGDFELPLQLPKWLWNGTLPLLPNGSGLKKHPYFKLKLNPLQQAVASVRWIFFLKKN